MADNVKVQLREERQASPVEDPVGALVAVTRPILVSILASIGAQYVEEYADDRGQMPLRMLGRLRKQGDAIRGSLSNMRFTTRFAAATRSCRSVLRMP